VYRLPEDGGVLSKHLAVNKRFFVDIRFAYLGSINEKLVKIRGMNNLKISVFNNVYHLYEPNCVNYNNYKPLRRFATLTRMCTTDDTAYIQPHESSGEQFFHNTPYPEGNRIQ
jgi:hypothetical protein